MGKMQLSDWSAQVKGRDGKCRNCGTVEDLHAHHIKPKATHPELILDVANGITLCYRCHKREHERNRPVRIRSPRPHRKTLERQIEELEREVASLRHWNSELKGHVAACERGACLTSKRRRRALEA